MGAGAWHSSRRLGWDANDRGCLVEGAASVGYLASDYADSCVWGGRCGDAARGDWHHRQHSPGQFRTASSAGALSEIGRPAKWSSLVGLVVVSWGRIEREQRSAGGRFSWKFSRTGWR